MEIQLKPIKNHVLNWGLILGLVMIFFSLIIHFSGIQQEKWIGYISFALFFAIVFLSQKFYRDSNPGMEISYGKAMSVGFMTGLVAAMIMLIYNYVFFSFIAPDQIDFMLEQARIAVYEMNLPSEAEDTAIQMQTRFITPVWIAVFAVFGTLFQALIASLLGAIFSKGKSTVDSHIENTEQ
jgi:hypothetical protein